MKAVLPSRSKNKSLGLVGQKYLKVNSWLTRLEIKMVRSVEKEMMGVQFLNGF